MRRASSLFDIDQEPLFEPLAVEREADGEPGWDDEFDESPTTPGTAGVLERHGLEQRFPVPGLRSRLLVAVAAVSAVGFLGSRLTQSAAPLKASLPSTPDRSAVVAAAQPSPPVRQGQKARRRGESARRASRRERTRRAHRAPRALQTEPQHAAMTSTARSAVTVPTPAAVKPSAQGAAPEHQGFTGEFF